MAGIQPSSGVSPSQTQNGLTNPQLAAGCENLWYAARCNPRLDPFAMNALISEIINLVNCGGNTYDCSRLDNLCTGVADLINDKIFGCMERTFPVANGCVLEQLVLSTDGDGCARIARRDASQLNIGGMGSCSVVPPGTSQNIPLDPTNTTTFYNSADLLADINSNSVNEAKLTPTILYSGTINIACDNQAVDFIQRYRINFNPAQNGGNGAVSAIVLRIDGEFTVIGGGTVVQQEAEFTNFVSSVDVTTRKTLSAGSHSIQAYVIAQSAARPPAQVQRSCTVANVSTSSLNVVRAIS